MQGNQQDPDVKWVAITEKEMDGSAQQFLSVGDHIKKDTHSGKWTVSNQKYPF
jgi:hypothetical protein